MALDSTDKILEFNIERHKQIDDLRYKQTRLKQSASSDSFDISRQSIEASKSQTRLQKFLANKNSKLSYRSTDSKKSRSTKSVASLLRSNNISPRKNAQEPKIYLQENPSMPMSRR